MKEKQGNQPNSYGKLMKRMLIYLGIGGVCGFFVGIFMTFGVKNGMSDLSDLVRPLALPIIAVIFVVSIVLMEFYSRKLKDTMKHLEEAEDEQYEVLSYEEEKYGAMLMNCNVISQVCDFIVLSFTFSRSWLEEASGKELAGFLAACVLFCINFFLYGYYQMRYVKMVQAAHPEKRGDMNSKNFQKDWMASCDEAEKEMMKTLVDDLVEMLAPIYHKRLTLSDLQEITKFYESPVGKKMAAAQPAIATESMAVGQQWGMKIATKVQESLKAKGYL